MVDIEGVASRMPRKAVITLIVNNESRLFAQLPQGVKHHLHRPEQDGLVFCTVHDKDRRRDLIQVEEWRLGYIPVQLFEGIYAHSCLAPDDIVCIAVSPARPAPDQFRRRLLGHRASKNIGLCDEERCAICTEAASPNTEFAVGDAEGFCGLDRRYDTVDKRCSWLADNYFYIGKKHGISVI